MGYLAAVILAVVLVVIITRQIKEHHLEYDPMLMTLKEVLKPVHPIFSKMKLYKGDKSYTINKERVFLCLFDENGNYYSLNTILYVTLHEAAHILNQENIGHTAEFQKKFDELLQRAIELGIYNPDIPVPSNYCEY